MNGVHSYLLVEGPQDVVFVGRLLNELGLRSVERADDLPAKWRRFLDKPLHQRDRAERQAGRAGVPFWQMFKPACLLNERHSVLIERVDGNRSRFAQTLRATGALIDGGLASLAGVGIMPDADTDPTASFASAQAALRAAGLPAPDQLKHVVAGAPNTGIFVLPGGTNTGGLEHVLIDCAAEIYPKLLQGARTLVNGVAADGAELTDDDLREFRQPQGQFKAVVGAVATVLKPGSTIQVSVRRDRWVTPATLALPRVNAIVQFLKSLCGIP